MRDFFKETKPWQFRTDSGRNKTSYSKINFKQAQRWNKEAHRESNWKQMAGSHVWTHVHVDNPATE